MIDDVETRAALQIIDRTEIGQHRVPFGLECLEAGAKPRGVDSFDRGVVDWRPKRRRIERGAGDGRRLRAWHRYVLRLRPRQDAAAAAFADLLLDQIDRV